MLQQPSFNVVTVFQSPACTTNINAPCDSLSLPSSSSLSPDVAALTTVAMATEEQAHHWGIWRQLGVKTPMLLEPYYWVCACVCSGVTVFIVVCSKPSDIFCRVIKRVSHRGIGAVESHTSTTTQEDKYNLEATMKAKGTLIFNVRPVTDLTTRKYNRGTIE